jgi:hypothetical protein
MRFFRPSVKCYLVQDKSAHEGSGGGFTVVRFFHLAVENRTPVVLQRVKAHYRLVRENECLQEGDLCVEQIESGKKKISDMFIRDSITFDRIEWDENVLVEGSEAISPRLISFDKTIPGSLAPTLFLAGTVLVFALLVLYYFFR